MKASIKLVTSEGKRKEGFPLYVFLVDGSKRSRKCIAHLDPEYWNSENNLPSRHYIHFNSIMPLILDVKAKCQKINFGTYSFMDAKELLFGIDNSLKSAVFIEAAQKYCGDTSTGKLNQTILTSFNNVYPGIEIENITPDHVKKYMKILLLKNSANGVHTYIRKLSTLYSRISNTENPFKGIRPKKVKTKNKNLTVHDLISIKYTCTYKHKFDGRNTYETINYDRYYYLLMFYLGGIDMVDLASLRYDMHVVGDRIQFYRNKGGTDAFVNNKLFPEALEILKKFNSYPFLVPINKYKNYHSFVNKTNKRFSDNTKDLQLTRKPLTKSARYSFINIAQQLLIDQRITMEIVGHTQTNTHSIYTDVFPLEVRDQSHKKIIDSIKLAP